MAEVMATTFLIPTMRFTLSESSSMILMQSSPSLKRQKISEGFTLIIKISPGGNVPEREADVQVRVTECKSVAESSINSIFDFFTQPMPKYYNSQ